MVFVWWDHDQKLPSTRTEGRLGACMIFVRVVLREVWGKVVCHLSHYEREIMSVGIGCCTL